jgi:hypothetical protein
MRLRYCVLEFLERRRMKKAVRSAMKTVRVATMPPVILPLLLDVLGDLGEVDAVGTRM